MFIERFFPDTQGGLEEVVRQIALNTPGFTAEVLTVSGQVGDIDHCLVDGISVTRLPRLTDFASSSIPRKGFNKYRILAQQSDLIHYHMPWPVGDLFHLLGGIDKPSVVTYHSDIIRQRFLRKLYAPLMHRFLTSVERIVTTSPNYRDSSQVLRSYLDKTEVIPIGIDTASYPVADEALKQSWMGKVGRGFFFFIGVLRYYKGLDILIDASKKSGLPVVIAGSGPEEQRLKQLAEELDAHNVRFVGRISDDDKMALLSLCCALVLPSYLRSEAFGVCLLEAQMMSKPIITADIKSGMSFVNQHGQTGLIVAPQDPAALARAMKVLADNPCDADLKGRAGRARFESLFTGKKMGAGYVDLYQRVLHERNLGRTNSSRML